MSRWARGLQQLALLQGFDLAELSAAEFVHVVVECGKLAFADRDASYGDAEDVPPRCSTEYNDERRTLGDDASAIPAWRGSTPLLRAAEATVGSVSRPRNCTSTSPTRFGKHDLRDAEAVAGSRARP